MFALSERATVVNIVYSLEDQRGLHKNRDNKKAKKNKMHNIIIIILIYASTCKTTG